METQTYRHEYTRGDHKEVLTFEVPDYFTTLNVRSDYAYTTEAYKGTEYWRRYAEAQEGEVVNLAGVPREDFAAWEAWKDAILPETIACVIGLEVDGVADPRSPEDLRAFLRNDVKRHDALRTARMVLFFHGGSPRDAE